VRASLAMAMAANTGPGTFETDIRPAVELPLAYPLTEWIGEDGVLDDRPGATPPPGRLGRGRRHDGRGYYRAARS